MFIIKVPNVRTFATCPVRDMYLSFVTDTGEQSFSSSPDAAWQFDTVADAQGVLDAGFSNCGYDENTPAPEIVEI